MPCFYKMTHSGLKKTTKQEFLQFQDIIAVVTEQALENSEENAFVHQFISGIVGKEAVRGCRMVQGTDGFTLECQIPSKVKGKSTQRFRVCMSEGKIICIQYTNDTENDVPKGDSFLEQLVENVVRCMQEQTQAGYVKQSSLMIERFLYELLHQLTAGDLQYIEKLEKALTVLEGEVFHGTVMDFNSNMLQLKKKIFQFYRYYSQLIEVETALEENERNLLSGEYTQAFRKLKERTQRLAAETQVLREYAVQVQEVYQSELGIRQNHIMKILTTVTTVFLPLTLIAGWYGMNFSYMPELSWQYGYPAVISVSLVIFVVLMWVFKRNRFW